MYEVHPRRSALHNVNNSSKKGLTEDARDLVQVQSSQELRTKGILVIQKEIDKYNREEALPLRILLNVRLVDHVVLKLLRKVAVNAVLLGTRKGFSVPVHLQLKTDPTWRTHEETADSSNLKVQLER